MLMLMLLHHFAKKILGYDWCTTSFFQRILIGSLVLLWRSFTNVRISLRCVYIVFKFTLILCIVSMRAALFAACSSALVFCGHGWCRGCICTVVRARFVAWIIWSSVFRRFIIYWSCPLIWGRGLGSSLFVLGARFALNGLFFWISEIQLKI